MLLANDSYLVHLELANNSLSVRVMVSRCACVRVLAGR